MKLEPSRNKINRRNFQCKIILFTVKKCIFKCISTVNIVSRGQVYLESAKASLDINFSPNNYKTKNPQLSLRISLWELRGLSRLSKRLARYKLLTPNLNYLKQKKETHLFPFF